jgi:hypothetical protein
VVVSSKDLSTLYLQVKDFFTAHRAYTRAWMRSMHSGSLKGRLKPASRQGGLQQPGRTEAEGKELNERGERAGSLGDGGKHMSEGTRLHLGASNVGGLQHSFKARLPGPQGGAGDPELLAGLPHATHDQSGSLKTAGGEDASAQGGKTAGTGSGVADQKVGMICAGPSTDGLSSNGGNAISQAKDTLVDLHDGAAMGAGGPAVAVKESELVLESGPQLGQLAGEVNTEGGAYSASRAVVEQASEGEGKRAGATGPVSAEALPLEPFQRAEKPNGLVLDLNAPPPREAFTEKKPLAQNKTPGSASGETVAAALALVAPERTAGGGLLQQRRVQPQATDLRGQLSQLGAAAEGERAAWLLEIMRREGSVAGRLQILEAVARAHRKDIHTRWANALVLCGCISSDVHRHLGV